MFEFIGDSTFGGKLIFTAKKEPIYEDFFKYFGVKESSYLDEVITRIFNYLFLSKKNLQNEFITFYYEEYSDFKDFLEKYYYFYDEIIENILKDIEKGKKVYLTDFEVKRDYNITDLFGPHYDDNIFKEKIYEYLEKEL